MSPRVTGEVRRGSQAGVGVLVTRLSVPEYGSYFSCGIIKCLILKGT